MDFTEKYCPETEKLDAKNIEKKVLSDDAYAIGEIIQNLINKIEQARLSLIK